jgi:hypothetical protein
VIKAGPVRTSAKGCFHTAAVAALAAESQSVRNPLTRPARKKLTATGLRQIAVNETLDPFQLKTECSDTPGFATGTYC